jgi:hypothetical protein
MMEKTWISNVTLGGKSLLFPMFLVASVSACAPQKPAEMMSFIEPPMQWDSHPEAEEWTDSTLVALSTKDEELSEQVPADIETWCPGYVEAPIEARRAFWAGLMSSVAKYESTWNPLASGGGGRWIGLMQISPRSAKNYGCEATSASALKDGEANLECAVEIMSNRSPAMDWWPATAAGAWARLGPAAQRRKACCNGRLDQHATLLPRGISQADPTRRA